MTELSTFLTFFPFNLFRFIIALMNKSQGQYFGELFKKFRLKSQFQTHAQLGDALAELNFSYENSIFSRWEHGNRIPRDRTVLITLIKLFIEREGFNNLSEANSFLEAAGQGYLTTNEINLLSIKPLKFSPFQAPRDIVYFTGRNEYLISIKNKLLAGGAILIYGLAGCGKTTLAIRLAHLLKDQFPDGVLWLRLDASSVMHTTTFIAESYGEDISKMQDLYSCASYIRSLLSPKKVLTIFDNVEGNSQLELLLPNSKNNSILITSRNENIGNLSLDKRIHLSVFSNKEALTLFEKILGENFVLENEKSLLEISELVGYLPLAINLIAQQLAKPNVKVQEIIQEIKKRKVKLSDFVYENKDLYTAIELSCKKLNDKPKKFFYSLSIFEGQDFSQETVSYINRLDTNEAKTMLLTLSNNSLIEYSSQNRYRLHPTIKFFLQNKSVNKILYERAIIFYTNFLKYKSRSVNYFSLIRPEIKNITYLFEKSLGKLKFTNFLFNFWREINKFLWFGGYWDDFYNLNKKIYLLALKLKSFLLKKYVCIDLGCVCYWLGDLDAAEKYTKEGLKVAILSKDKNFMAQSKDRLGKIYQLKCQFKKSIKYLQSAYNILKKTTDYEKIGNVLRHIGEGYMMIQNFKEAKEELNLALKKYSQIKDLTVRNMYQALINSHLGIVYFKQNKLVKAEKVFICSLDFEKTAGGRAGTKIGSKLGLGLIFEQRKQIDKAKQYFKEAEEEIEILGIKNEVEKLNVCMLILKKNFSKSLLYKSSFH